MKNMNIYNNSGMKLMCIAHNNDDALFIRIPDGMPIIGRWYKESDDGNNVMWGHGIYGAFRDYVDDENYFGSLKYMIDKYMGVEEPDRDSEILSRIRWLEGAHEIMISMNNEEAYYEWIIEGVPDSPNASDYQWIAESDSEFKDVKDFFYRVYNEYKKYGVYEPSYKAKEFIKTEKLDIDII